MRHRCSGVYQNNTFLNRGNGKVSLVRCNRSRVGEKFNLVLAGRPKNIDSFYRGVKIFLSHLEVVVLSFFSSQGFLKKVKSDVANMSIELCVCG